MNSKRKIANEKSQTTNFQLEKSIEALLGSWYLREKAVKKLRWHHEEVLEKVAIYDPSPDVRLAAIKKISSNRVLKKIALHDPDPDVRLAAVYNITDGDTLSLLYQKEKDDEVIKAILDQMGF